MAEQNRKTAQQQELREQAQKVVEDFLDYLFANKEAEDIAMEARHILGTYSEHGGLPQGSGFSGFCKLAAKIDQIRRYDVTPEMQEAKRLMDSINDKSGQVDALCIECMYRGKTRAKAVDPLNGKAVEITYHTSDCAGMLGVSEDVYRKRVSRGFQRLELAMAREAQAA